MAFCLPPVALLLVSAAQYSSALQLQVLEGPVHRVPADTLSPLTVRFFHNASDPHDVQEIADFVSSNVPIVVSPWIEDEWRLNFANSSMMFLPEEVEGGSNKTFFFSSFYWGYTNVFFYGTYEKPDPDGSEVDDDVTEGTEEDVADADVKDDMDRRLLLSNDTLVVVDRKPSSKTLDTVFMVLATTFMLINTVNMGCQLDLKIIAAVLKKPVGPLCGIVSQFIGMPMFSFLIGWLLLEDSLQRLGLFTLGCSPGGNVSNFWTLLFNGDINLSITMTFVSTIIAMGMMPLWMWVLGSRLMGENDVIKIPYGNLIMSLVALTVPIVIGLLIKYKKKSWAAISSKIIKPMTFCLLIFLITVGIYNSYKSFALMTWNVVIAGFLVAFAGYSAGALLSFACCLQKKQIIAISIETAFQNAAIAFLILKLSLPTPDSDLASVPVLAQLFQTGPPLLTLYLIWQCLQKCGLCMPDTPSSTDDAAGDPLKEDISHLVRPLMDLTPEEVPRTPGLLFDPSIPAYMRQSNEKVAET